MSKRYIEFRNGLPLCTNSKCRQCFGQCKQHFFIMILQCPDFKPSKSRKEQNADRPLIGEGIKNKPLEARFKTGKPKPFAKNKTVSNRGILGVTAGDL